MLKKSAKIQNDFLTPAIVLAAKDKNFECTKTLVPQIVNTPFGEKLQISGILEGKEYTYTTNNTTKDSLIDTWGEDETMWKGKKVLLATAKTMTGDGMKDAIYTEKHILESSN